VFRCWVRFRKSRKFVPEVWRASRRSGALSEVSSGFPGSREGILLYDVWFEGPGKCLGVGYGSGGVVTVPDLPEILA
jgi:hypothetical protein